MVKTVEEIIIKADGIDVISNINGVNNVTQLSLESGEDEQNIFERYNLNTLNNYPFDMRIARALSNNEEQLKDYLDICRRAHYSKGKISILDSIPHIEYDLKDLKNSSLSLESQLDMYKQANITKEIFKSKKGIAEIKLSLIDKAYYAIQEFLANRKRETEVHYLAAGQNNIIRNLREELKNPELTAKTNEVSNQYKEKQHENPTKENEEREVV